MNLNATILGQSISFVLFLLFCMKYIWPPIISAIEKRKKEIETGLTSVAQAKEYLISSKNEADNQLKKAQKEAEMIIEKAKKNCIRILDEAKIHAKSEYKKIIHLAQKEISEERKRTYEELRSQLSDLIILGAEKIIEHSVSSKLNKNIIDKIISNL